MELDPLAVGSGCMGVPNVVPHGTPVSFCFCDPFAAFLEAIIAFDARVTAHYCSPVASHAQCPGLLLFLLCHRSSPCLEPSSKRVWVVSSLAGSVARSVPVP